MHAIIVSQLSLSIFLLVLSDGVIWLGIQRRVFAPTPILRRGSLVLRVLAAIGFVLVLTELAWDVL